MKYNIKDLINEFETKSEDTLDIRMAIAYLKLMKKELMAKCIVLRGKPCLETTIMIKEILG